MTDCDIDCDDVPFACPGTGLNLQDVSYRVVFTTPSFVPADELQGIGRVVRHGQQEPVVIYRFLVQPLDLRTMSIQFKKMQVMEKTHGGYGGLPQRLLGDAASDEPMLQALTDAAAGPSGSGSGTQQDEAEQEEADEDDEARPSKRSKGKGKARASSGKGKGKARY